MGVRVIVSPRNDVVPQQFDHPSLVALATKPATPDVAAPDRPGAPTPTMEKTEAAAADLQLAGAAHDVRASPAPHSAKASTPRATPRCRPPRPSRSTSSPATMPSWRLAQATCR